MAWNRRALVLALVVVLALLVCGCGKMGSKGLVGKWRGTQALAQRIEFTDDNRLEIRSMMGYQSTWYKVDGEKLTTGRLLGPTDDFGTWRIEGDSLIIRQHPLITGTYKRAE